MSACFASVSAATRRSSGVMKKGLALLFSSFAFFRFAALLCATPPPAFVTPCSAHRAQNHSFAGVESKSTHLA